MNNKYFSSHHVPILISEIKSSTIVDADKKIYKTKNDIVFSSVETIGCVSAVKVTDEKVYAIVTDMVDESIHVSGSSDTIDDFIKEKIATLAQLSLILIRGNLSVYESENEVRYTIYPKDIIVYDNDENGFLFRSFWYNSLLKNRIENSYPIINTSDLYMMIKEDGYSYQDIGNDLIKITATVEKQRPRPVSLSTKEPEKKRNIGPVQSSSPEKKKIKKEDVDEKKEKEGKEPVMLNEIVIKKMIIDFVKDKKNVKVDDIYNELEGKGVNIRDVEMIVIDLFTKKIIDVDSNNNVMMID